MLLFIYKRADVCTVKQDTSKHKDIEIKISHADCDI